MMFGTVVIGLIGGFVLLTLGFTLGVITGFYETPPFNGIKKFYLYIRSSLQFLKNRLTNSDAVPEKLEIATSRCNSNSQVRILIPDITHAHCVVIDVSDGETVLIGCGREKHGEKIEAYIDDMGVENIDILMVTNYQSDHVGGLQYLNKTYQFEQAFLPPDATDSEGNKTAILSELDCSIKYFEEIDQGIEINNRIQLDAFHFSFNSEIPRPENNTSVILHLSTSGGDIMFMSDAKKDAEMRLIESSGISDVDILHVGHHAKPGSNSMKFLQQIDPDVAIINASDNNPMYVTDTVDKLETLCNAKVYWDTRVGATLIRFIEDKFIVQTEEEG